MRMETFFFVNLVSVSGRLRGGYERARPGGEQEPGGGLTAMTTQQMLMYGLSRSPILAHFQKMPMTLILPRRSAMRVVG